MPMKMKKISQMEQKSSEAQTLLTSLTSSEAIDANNNTFQTTIGGRTYCLQGVEVETPPPYVSYSCKS